MFQVDPEAVDRGMRSKAKAVNFGILYGQGAFGLAQNLGIPRREAKEIIDAYFVEFAQLKAFTADCVDRVREPDTPKPFSAAAVPAGHRLQQRHRPRLRRTECSQRADPRLGSGHHQSRHGAHAGRAE